MALHRGIQSAIFYYLSCAPCSDAQYRKRRKQEAKRDRVERAALEAHMPGLYRHPSPSSTNRYWQTEIDAGPTPSRTKRKQNTSESQRGLKTSLTQSSAGSNVPSSVDLNPLDARADKMDGKGPSRMSQREDEELWGAQMTEARSRTARAPFLSNDHLPTRPPTARTTDSASPQTYHHTNNPAVNDLHPPTTRKVTSREEILWMLQPPPVAAVMSGKEHPGRNRSDSGSSKPSVGSETPLSRQASTRLLERRLKAGETPGVSREHSTRTTTDTTGQPHDRHNTQNLRPESARTSADDVRRGRKEKRRPSPIQISDDLNSSSTTAIHHPSDAEAGALSSQHKSAATRPRLSTIVSDSALTPEIRRATTLDAALQPNYQKENTNLHQPPQFRKIDFLQTSKHNHLHQPSPRLTTSKSNKHLSTPSPPGPLVLRFPAATDAQDGQDSHDAPGGAESGPEDFDSWYTPDFELPKWIHEHTKREVRTRWSFDI